MSSVVKLIKGYHSIIEEKRELKPFVFDTNEILGEVNLGKNDFSQKISQLNIETLDVLDGNIKLLEDLTLTEFELLLNTLEPYLDKFSLSVEKLRKAFIERNAVEWNEAIESSTIKSWDIMASYKRLSSNTNGMERVLEEWKEKGTLEWNLYYNKFRELITTENLADNNITPDNQIYLRARVFAKLERLFNARNKIVPDTIDVLKKYINRNIKPIVRVLLRILMGETGEILHSDIEKYEKKLNCLLRSGNEKNYELNRNIKGKNSDDGFKQI
jgi:hypothetical protein